LSTETTTTPLRADAARNREKLIDAATALFVESGTDVSLEAVAKRAGVGIGTLYRHFSTRDALVEAVYRNEVAQVSAAAGELLAEHPADVALAEWVKRFAAYLVTKRGMADALHAMVESRSDCFADSKKQMHDAVKALVDAGIADGSIRPDADADDVLRAMSAVWSIPDPAQAERVLGLLLDGLRYGTRA